ncbi:MAG: Asp-tRNA(Asn)/Glu-tRNA(Gln) amidotransferase subunit GatA [Planctomycetes bacterium]|nr:Asp-tRNA(Asn)/Glu-tRNA(Gln) amidotransferase subunit GatA [Planctomycetota bacterium]
MKITPEQFAGLTLESAAKGVLNGEFGAIDLVEASVARMIAFEPSINAVITWNEDSARERAIEQDACARDDKMPLRGLPMAVKDNLMTRDLRTTCGSKILDNFRPPNNAEVVNKIEAAGAIIIAKANLDEFAMGATGENSAYGPTRNPWDRSRVPGGSSSGSAAAVAYGGVLASLASDTGGSIRLPASFCGLVGIKPTYGRVSRNGAAALASSLDQIGPITRTVRDNAFLLDILSGYDPLDSTSAPAADSAAPCLAAAEDGVKGLRIGYDPSVLSREGISPIQAGALKRSVDICRAGGAEIREVEIPLLEYGVAAYYLICFCEASANLARFDGVRYGVRQGEGDLWNVYAETRGKGFGDEVKRRIMLGSYALSKGYYDAYYLKAAKVRRLLTDEFVKLFKDIDVLLTPVAPQPPRPLGAKTTVVENYLGDLFTLSANLTGLPALAFPIGVFQRLPAGTQAMAAAFREDLLYRVAREAEKNTRLIDAPWTKPKPEGL